MKTLRFVALWWLALFGWWILLVGTNSGLEEIAAACAAAIGTAFALGIRRQRLLRFGFEPRWLAKTLGVPWKVVRELGVVFWALALHLGRVRPVASAYRAIPFPAGRQDAVSAGRRAVVSLADAISPNAYSVDMDCERNLVLRHELDPRHSSNDVP
jgi:hypothetical protein